MRKYKCIRQGNQEDCAPACLATVVKSHGKQISLNYVRALVGTGKHGSTLLDLRRAAEALGFNARSVQALPVMLDKLHEIPLPAILHWKGNHFVTLYGKKRNHYIISDPAVGIRRIQKSELMSAWSDRKMLLLEPDSSRFFQQIVQSKAVSYGIGRFFSRVTPYRSILLQTFLINVVIGGFSLTSPFLIQMLTDDVLIRGDTHLLKGLSIAIIAITIVSSLLNLIQSNLITQFTQRLELGLAMEFGRKILQLPLSYYESRRSGEVVSRLQDVQQINQLVSQSVISLPSQFFIALVSLGLMVSYSGKLVIFVLLLSVSSTFSTLLFIPQLQQKIRSIMVLDAENQGVLVETFKGALAVKTTSSQQQFWEELQCRFGRLARLVNGTAQISIINGTFSSLISSIGGVGLLWLGSSLVIERELTIGQLLAFNGMSSNLLGFINSVVGFTDEFMRVRTASQRLSEVIDAQPEVNAMEKKMAVSISDRANIIFSQVSFYHTGRAELLNQFSLDIPGGKVTSIIGHSGCGKSSLVKLITGLYTYQSGNIQIGDYNLRDLDLDNLRQQVVLVPQDSHFWSRSIVDNFQLGSPNVSFEEIVHACKITGADSFISGLANSYQTVLGEFGANLSGGQKQRLAIARAITSDPPILILDESTSGLDPNSEAELLDRLLDLRRGKTTLLISHRSKVIERADWIIFLEEGKLKAQGTSEDLRNEEGNHTRFFSV